MIVRSGIMSFRRTRLLVTAISHPQLKMRTLTLPIKTRKKIAIITLLIFASLSGSFLGCRIAITFAGLVRWVVKVGDVEISVSQASSLRVISTSSSSLKFKSIRSSLVKGVVSSRISSPKSSYISS